MNTSCVATRVVIMVQENHTTDHYFRSMREFGANVATDGPISPNPPTDNPPHDRHAYYRWLTAQQSGAPTPARHDQFDTMAVLPFYAYLAATGAFLENHCSGFGTNSTPNHLLIVGGQSPTLRNPPRSAPQPLWDMPSLPGHAAEHGVTWKAYTGASGYPVEFYTQLHGSPNIVDSNEFVTDAAAGALPTLSMMWHDSPADEHPPADVSIGHDAIWQAVDRGRRRRPVGHHRIPAYLGRLGRIRRPRCHTGPRTHSRRGAARLRAAGAVADVRRPGHPRRRQPVVLSCQPA